MSEITEDDAYHLAKTMTKRRMLELYRGQKRQIKVGDNKHLLVSEGAYNRVMDAIAKELDKDIAELGGKPYEKEQ